MSLKEKEKQQFLTTCLRQRARKDIFQVKKKIFGGRVRSSFPAEQLSENGHM